MDKIKEITEKLLKDEVVKAMFPLISVTLMMTLVAIYLEVKGYIPKRSQVPFSKENWKRAGLVILLNTPSLLCLYKYIERVNEIEANS